LPWELTKNIVGERFVDKIKIIMRKQYSVFFEKCKFLEIHIRAFKEALHDFFPPICMLIHHPSV
jgi:hypothetical protein